MDWLIWVMLSSLFSEIQAVRLNPFAGFSDQQHEPVADYSIHQGVYLSNMPTTSIFPIMTDENINGMVGIPSLQSPFINPLLQQQQSLFGVAKQNMRNKPKNTRINQSQLSGGNTRNQGNSQQKPRGMTLDIRGGGYRLEQPRSHRPYKPPGPGENSAQRPNAGRNAASSVNRKQVQRPRHPTRSNLKLPANAEFVNPENVLPLHPRIYKQFLQQNPQAAALLRSQKPSASNYAGTSHSNSFDASKQMSQKYNRNRGSPPRTHLAALSSFSNGQNNFHVPTSQQSAMQLNFGSQGQPALSQGRQPTFEDFYNSDPQFYASLSQTPEGKAMLNQLYQHFGSSANKPSSSSLNKAPANIVQSSNPFSQTYADINSYALAAGYNPASNIPPGHVINQFASNIPLSGQTNERFNRPTSVDYSSASQFNQKPQQPINQQQHIMQYQHAVQPQQILQSQLRQPQGISHSSISSSSQQSDYSGRQPERQIPTYVESIPSPVPTTDPKITYTSPQNVPNQYNQYSGSGYSDDSSSSSSLANGGAEYDPATYQSHYQEVPKVIDGSTIDHAAYSSNFSPVDPLKTIENANVHSQSFYTYPSGESASYSASSSRFPSTALHEISPSEIVKRQPEPSAVFKPQPAKSVNAPGYWTPEQLFAPQSTGLQKDSPFDYPAAVSSSNHNQQSQDEHQDGSERAALHLSEDASAWPAEKPQEPAVVEYSEAVDMESDEGKENPTSTEQPEYSPTEEESDEQFKASIRDLQKLWTRVPQRSSVPATRATTVIYRSTEPPPQKITRDDMRNHKTTPSYTFQYSPAEKANSKNTAAWWSRKSDGTRYKIPAPQHNTTTASTTSTTTFTTPTTTTTTTTTATTAAESPEPTHSVMTTTPSPTSFATATSTSNYQDNKGDTPICAKHNNLTYCLQDPEYPKDSIREAIEKNRHPLDHFLVDISAASNVVDDQTLHNVFENSAPLQSTSVSYSFEGKVISPDGEMLNSTGCNSNVYYAKPLRALNTAGLWKVIVNVEFEDTGANYTQTVRIEECTHPPGYVATCGTHSISACLQQYKLYRLLSWEAHRGFYIDAFLLPVACFCGSQES